MSIQTIHETIRNNSKEVHLINLNSTRYEVIPITSVQRFDDFDDDFYDKRASYFTLLAQLAISTPSRREKYLQRLETTLASRVVKYFWNGGTCPDKYAVVNFQLPNTMAYVGFNTFLDAIQFSQHMICPSMRLKGFVFEQRLSLLYKPVVNREDELQQQCEMQAMLLNSDRHDSIGHTDEPELYIWSHGIAQINDLQPSVKKATSGRNFEVGPSRKGKHLDKHDKQKQEKYERKEKVDNEKKPKRGKGKWNKRNKLNESDQKLFYVEQDTIETATDMLNDRRSDAQIVNDELHYFDWWGDW
jgi:hypothetical protein